MQQLSVLVIGKFYTEGFARHIAETLESMGHKVLRFEVGLNSTASRGRVGTRIDQVRHTIYSATDNLPSVRARRKRALWKAVERATINLVIVCHDFLWPSEVSELKRCTGAPVVMWFPDSFVNFGRAFFMNAPYDALFFKDPYIVHVLGSVLSCGVYYLPECFNPKCHWLPEHEIGEHDQYKCDITTAGNPHSWRIAFYKNLLGYNVKLWGQTSPLWMVMGQVGEMYQGRTVNNFDKVRAFRGAKIVINNIHYGEIWGVNARCFEAAGAGAFQIMDWRPMLGHLFEDGRELITFRNITQLREQIDYWLPRHDERREIAAAGMRRAHANHTYALRLQLLISTVGGCQRGYPLPQAPY